MDTLKILCVKLPNWRRNYTFKTHNLKLKWSADDADAVFPVFACLRTALKVANIKLQLATGNCNCGGHCLFCLFVISNSPYLL